MTTDTTIPRRTELLQARVTPDERERVLADATAAGLTISEYLRLLSLTYHVQVAKREH